MGRISRRRRLAGPAVMFLLFAATPPALAGWSPDGVAVVVQPRNQIGAAITPDDEGGAIFAWSDSRNSSGVLHSFDIYAHRISAAGAPLWAENGIPICSLSSSEASPVIAADGTGGAIVAWVLTSSGSINYDDIYAQRVDAMGNALWAANGVPVCTANGLQSAQSVLSDGAGGAFIIWQDYRSTCDIYAQHVDASGSMLWESNGRAVCVKSGRQQAPVFTSDGAGGFFAAWEDTSSTAVSDVFAQRFDGAGVRQWASTGVALCTLPGYQSTLRIIGDGAGGAVVAWQDQRVPQSSDIGIQRVNGSGVVQWGSNGLLLCDAAGSQSSVSIRLVDATVFALWRDDRNGGMDLYAQRLDLDGNALWSPNGIVVCNEPGTQTNPRMVADRHGGVIVGWTDYRGASADIYVQRLDGEGQRLWDPAGVAICAAPGLQALGPMTSDGTGGVLAAWSDFRDGTPDIYVQHVALDGAIVTAAAKVPRTGLERMRNYPNPFSASTVVEFELEEATPVTTELFDVAGRRVRLDEWGERASGSVHLTIAGRGRDGRLLPNGIYFLRVTAGSTAATRKIAVSH